MDRPSTAALGCFAVAMIFLAMVGGSAVVYAATGFGGSPPTGQRVTGAVTGGVFLLLLGALVMATVSATRTRTALTFDERGVWWSDRRGPIRVDWADLVAARLLGRSGPKRGQSGTPVLELYPREDTLAASIPQLREKLSAGEPPEPELPGLRFAFRLPGAEAATAVRTEIPAVAPLLRWLDPPREPARRARRKRSRRTGHGTAGTEQQ